MADGPDTDAHSAILPAHIDDTVREIAKLHAAHQARATPLQRIVVKLTARAGRPSFILLLTAAVAVWIAVNLALIAAGRKPFDEPPFAWLQGAVALAALYMTALILTTQRHEDEIANHRAQLSTAVGNQASGAE